ncbi:hypothetical protein BDZ94DRAFT_1203283 [Collybia nuda]|uniref:DUF2421 domain-containing protein n=1 Tax=Collybia nuda TaxID=64659 RepID=A0A9P5XV27_9AGAR|nr:hypothetical protein BDZ94DRAFT_1203283 [Collybia nuda]
MCGEPRLTMVHLASFLSPPSDPFMAVFEREMLILLFASCSWAWSCLGIRLADLARTNRDPSATLFSAATGQYVEGGPTIILAVFIFVGSAVFLYIKARQGPGPYLFATVFACICLDISLTTAALFPYPLYLVGKSILLPLTFHSAIALLASIFIFPSTISAQFTTRLQGVLTPLESYLEVHRSLLKSSPHTPSFVDATTDLKTLVGQSEAGLLPLSASTRLLRSDLIYGRFAPDDFHPFQNLARRIVGRANGMGMYFTLIDPTREKFPVTPAPSVPATPIMSPSPTVLSRAPSFERIPLAEHRDGAQHDRSEPTSPLFSSRSRRESHFEKHAHSSPHRSRSTSRQRSHGHIHQVHHHRHPHHKLLHSSLLHLSLSRSHRYENAVGVFESQRYLNLEATRFNDPDAKTYTTQTTLLLHESCDDLLAVCGSGVATIREWFDGVRDGRFKFWIPREEKEARWKTKLAALQKIKGDVSTILEHFRDVSRHRVLDPYRPAFEDRLEGHIEPEIPAHRYLFHCYVYQYHLIQFACIVVEMLEEVIRLETERRDDRVWTPVRRIMQWNNWEIPENAENNDDEDPNFIQGLEPAILEDLGMPRRRDPDALPPNNIVEQALNIVYHAVLSIGGGNALFAIKAALLTVILCIPSFLKSTASFAYENRFVWAIFMGQLTIARFRGDTAFGLVARIGSTFLGGVVGLVMWYTSCGSGRGNAFGFAAVCAVCFPFFFFARLYWPGPPMTVIVFFVTSTLVIGYSYQDLHVAAPGSPGFGFPVFWKRFVLVTVGVVAAFIMSFLPPSTTIRRYQRATLATTSSQIGAIYCAILSFANSRREEEIPEIVSSLVAIRSKLKRSDVLRTNIVYEFSLRGRWPAERYRNILEIQLQITHALNHLMSVVKHLEPAWARALLRRTRFLDTDFQGDILAVISMISSSLRTGTPLPQITPSPLLDRFMLQYHGLDVIHKDAEEDYGLPRTLTLDTLKNEQYLIFCVGVSTSFSIMTRLDRLMVAAKEIVGEQYYIHGVGYKPSVPRGEEPEFGRASIVHFSLSQDV